MSPGLRVAYCVGPKPVLAKMTVGKQAEDVHTAMLNQMIVYQWFRQYDVDAHIEKIRGIYRKKLELMCNCIDSDLGDFVEYVRPPRAVCSFGASCPAMWICWTFVSVPLPNRWLWCRQRLYDGRQGSQPPYSAEFLHPV